MPSKSDCWNGSSRSSAARRARLVLGQDHLLHDRQPLVAEEHVLGAAEADALGAELARAGGVLGRVGVRAHLRRRASSAQPRIVWKSSFSSGSTSGTAPRNTCPVPPSIVIWSPSRSSCPATRATPSSSDEGVAARDARLAHPARDDGRVRGHAAADGEDPLGRDHPVDVVGRRLACGRGSPGRPSRARPPCRRRRRCRRSPRPGSRSGRARPPRARAPGRSSDAAAGRAAPGRCARAPPRARSAPPRPSTTAIASAAVAVRFAARVCSR